MIGILTGQLRAKRLEQVWPYVRGSVLDLGVGDAPLLERISDTTLYVGVDVRPGIINWLRQHYPSREFHRCDLDREALPVSGKFDTIVMMAVIEHLAQPDFVLRQIPSLLNPSGRLILTTPSPFGNKLHHLGSQVRLFSKDAAEDHKFLFNRQGLDSLLRSSGLEMLEFHTFLLGQNQLCAAGFGQG